MSEHHETLPHTNGKRAADEAARASTASEARKRRRQIRAASTHPTNNNNNDIINNTSTSSTCKTPPKQQPCNNNTLNNKSPPSPLRNKPNRLGNTQLRYDPNIPMGKEQAAAWRREARRVRNRESAAASRQKTRDRISVLKEESDGWKNRCTNIWQLVGMMEDRLGVEKTATEEVEIVSLLEGDDEEVLI